MIQKSIGEVLRSARESRGWNFVEIQRLTGIQAKYLQALEFNNFDVIPDPSYTRSFLQKYAEVLDLDGDVLVDAFMTNSLVIYHEDGQEEEHASELKRSYKVRKKKPSILPLVYLLLAATSIFILLTYVVLNRVQNQERKELAPSTVQVVSESSPASTEEASDTSSTSTDESSSSSSQEELASGTLKTSGGGSELTVVLSEHAGPVEVELSVTDATSWVSLSDTEIAGGFVLSPETNTVTATIPEGINAANLVLGVTEGVSIKIAGNSLDTSAITADPGVIYLTVE
ncbi:helix-turn-helix domain-containing protein [Streptococcus suis]|uniref:helix-turn-helix domain-containing protein n=1 Tax=Streptococcus suis TaxID=1307 RepID=UPI001478BA1E|nr:helix-turn-helix domain-containing protein [Streptococcus suis]